MLRKEVRRKKERKLANVPQLRKLNTVVGPCTFYDDVIVSG